VRLRYSGVVAGSPATPLAKKLGITEGVRVALVNAPTGVLAGLPPRVVVTRQARGRADVVVAFFTERAILARRLDRLATMVFPAGGLWIAWPKRASGRASTVDDGVIRDLALPLGLVDNKVCAIDDTWSGLRLVGRRERRG
jgi:hypothetical protein